MPAECFSSVQGLVMRATRVTACGVPVSGTSSSVVSDGFVSIQLAPETEDGTEYKVKKANGTYCINDRGAPLLSWYNITAEFCEVDPELYELMAGTRILEDWDGNSVGYAIDEGSPGRTHFALEVWTKLGGDECVGTGQRWIYWLFAHLVDGIFGDQTIEDGPMSFTLNSRTKRNPNWLCGPYNVVAQNGAGTAGPLLTPGYGATDHLYTRLTEIAPPTASCGYSGTVGAIDNCA